MNFNFNTGRITLIIAPVDMRAGYERLSLIAASLFGIDVDAGKDFVVFISRPRKIVKRIWTDERGASLLTRRLKEVRLSILVPKMTAGKGLSLARSSFNFLTDIV